MKMTDEIAAPELVEPTNFNLDNIDFNRRMATKYFSMKQKDVIDESEQHQFFRVGDDSNGKYIAYDKHLKEIYYLIVYHRMQKKVIGQTVTQTLLWRAQGNPLIELGFTVRIVFDILLPKWGAIMSDGQQTARGKEFWLNIVSRAWAKGLRVGYVDTMKNVLIEPDIGENIVEFWRRMDATAYGKGQKYRSRRFFIQNKQR